MVISAGTSFIIDRSLRGKSAYRRIVIHWITEIMCGMCRPVITLLCSHDKEVISMMVSLSN